MTIIDERESLCEFCFRTGGPYWHIWTSENHEIIFESTIDFEAAMNIIGIASRLNPKVRIITFEWMSNHLHSVVAGVKEEILTFVDTLSKLLERYFKGSRYEGGPIRKAGLKFSYRELTRLTEVRNVIAYDNRNGYLVSPDESPYSYPWGANRYFFNPDAKEVYGLSRMYFTVKGIRTLIHCHMADKISPLKMVYGYVCPKDFCYIEEGEQLFSCASQYFHCVSKSVESYKSIAEELSENIFMTDEEMFGVACRIASNQFKMKISELDNASRVEVARTMHFNYNAGNKQISRILKLPLSLVDTIFPKK